MTEYLIDSNIFIEPYQRYYNFDIAPTYWDKFLTMYKNSILLVDKVKVEICKQTDDGKKDELQKWVEDECLPLNKGISSTSNQEVFNKFRAINKYVKESPYYKDSSYREWFSNPDKADPWPIAIAAVHGYTIVTFENQNNNLSSKNPTKKEPRIPDIRKEFDVECIDLFELMRRENCVI
ncbi:DUF4411 family protein [Staphylococcus pettenkoferi]|uniref:DUF4411 family protein n=1 Tax=Staphylococcus pettenkoferi TaxID=170573 RepID=UPI0022749005|nr:DUF4411 family protein [Staphylococcus pettenkoferi]MCY1606417.1 DUF4411 family protein [Staphylococcus pettenkoferi]